MFSIQDVGVRFYTYISTMFNCMEAAAKEGIRFVVLDRPNPITGNRIEGNVSEEARQSFIAVRPLPVRHGMTIGELATMFNDVYGLSVDLSVARMEKWDRSAWFDETTWQWIMPSPAMPSLETAIVYPGTCLYESMNISVGRGTSRPFELIGAPCIDPFHLTDAMNEKSLAGSRFRPVYFVPTYRTHEGAEHAILAMGAPAFLAGEAAATLTKKGRPTDVLIINGLPLSDKELETLLAPYAGGVVTVEDGFIGTAATGVRGFAGLVASKAADAALPVSHVGITDPTVAPSNGHMETWAHFGITTQALTKAVQDLG